VRQHFASFTNFPNTDAVWHAGSREAYEVFGLPAGTQFMTAGRLKNLVQTFDRVADGHVKLSCRGEFFFFLVASPPSFWFAWPAERMLNDIAIFFFRGFRVCGEGVHFGGGQGDGAQGQSRSFFIIIFFKDSQEARSAGSLPEVSRMRISSDFVLGHSF
jgi:hypothetical protein